MRVRAELLGAGQLRQRLEVRLRQRRQIRLDGLGDLAARAQCAGHCLAALAHLLLALAELLLALVHGRGQLVLNFLRDGAGVNHGLSLLASDTANYIKHTASFVKRRRSELARASHFVALWCRNESGKERIKPHQGVTKSANAPTTWPGRASGG